MDRRERDCGTDFGCDVLSMGVEEHAGGARAGDCLDGADCHHSVLADGGEGTIHAALNFRRVSCGGRGGGVDFGDAGEIIGTSVVGKLVGRAMIDLYS